MSSELPRRLQELACNQAGVVSRQQALTSGMPARAIDSKLTSGRWRALYRASYITHNGPLPRNAQLWGAVLYAGRGARLSHETAAEIIGLTDSQWPGIQISIPPERRVVPVAGVVIHTSSYNGSIWRPPPGVPPHTSEEDTVLDLVHAAANLDDVLSWVTRALAKPLTSEPHLRRAMAQRKQLRWRRSEDQARDNANARTGATLRYGWDDVTRRACETALQEAEALRSRGWTGTLKPCSPACRASYPVRPANTLAI